MEENKMNNISIVVPLYNKERVVEKPYVNNTVRKVSLFVLMPLVPSV